MEVAHAHGIPTDKTQGEVTDWFQCMMAMSVRFEEAIT